MEKKCKRCGDTKLLEEYHVHKIAKDGRQNVCKDCRKKMDRERYLSSDKKKEQSRLYREAIIKKINEYKASHGCRYCEEHDPVALDFHHSDQNKEDHVSKLAWNGSLERVMKEIDKCVVVCSNDHRKLHAGQTLLPRR